MGSINTKQINPPDGEEGKLYRVREVNLCGCCGRKVDEESRFTEKWPVFCQWWTGDIRKRCIPPCMYSELRGDHAKVVTPLTYWNKDDDHNSQGCAALLYYTRKKNGKGFSCAACCGWGTIGCCTPCCAVLDDVTICGKRQNIMHFIYVFGHVHPPGTEEPTCCDTGEICWTPGMLCLDGYCHIPCVSIDMKDPKLLFNKYCSCSSCIVPNNCCVLGFGTTRKWRITPCGCIEKNGMQFYTICGYNNKNGEGYLICPPTRIYTTYDGENFTNDIELNTQIRQYNSAHRGSEIAIAPVQHFSGPCICGDGLEKDAIFPLNEFSTEYLVRQQVTDWIENHSQPGEANTRIPNDHESMDSSLLTNQPSAPPPMRML